jgi:hypothetical protein
MPRVAFGVSRLLPVRDPTDEEIGMSSDDDDASRPRRSTLAIGSGGVPRPRRSTLETFNDEMAALDRPIEGEVEYFDEAPPPSRWRQAGGLVVVMAIVGVGGALLISRHRAAADPHAQASPPVAPAPAAPAPVVAAVPSPAPVVAEVAAPAAAMPPAADEGASDDDASTGDDGGSAAAPRATGSKAAWGKVRSKAGHAKHARAAAGKTTYRRTTTVRHTVVSKHTVTRHH